MELDPGTRRALEEALSRLEVSWRTHRAPIADHLSAGATAQHLDHVESRLGGPLPPELRAWWSWHDGVHRAQPGTRLGPESRIGAGAWEFLSSTEALDDRDWRREISQNASAADDQWEGGWRSEWIPFLTFDAHARFVDYRQVTPVGTAPIRDYDHTPEDVFTPVAGSLLQIVQTWTFLLEERFFYWDSKLQHWEDRWAAIPPPLRRLT